MGRNLCNELGERVLGRGKRPLKQKQVLPVRGRMAGEPWEEHIG